MTTNATVPDTLFARIIGYLPTPIAIWRLDTPEDPTSLRFVTANPASAASMGADAATLAGRRMVDIYPGSVPPQVLEAYAGVARSGHPLNLGEVSFQGPDGTSITFELQIFPLGDNHIGIVHVNVTSHKQAEAALLQAKLQEEVIRAQEAALAELSTPLLAVGDGVVVMPLVGSIDSRRASQVMERLLEGVSTTSARAVILDITGIPIVDTQVANAFVRAAQAVKLLGARVILTGIRPEVAQTLVGLGVDLSGIVTRGTLENGITEALGRAAQRN